MPRSNWSRVGRPLAAAALVALTAGYAAAQPGRPGGRPGGAGGGGVLRIPGTGARVHPGVPGPGPGWHHPPAVTHPVGPRPLHHPHFPHHRYPVIVVPGGGSQVVVEPAPVVVLPSPVVTPPPVVVSDPPPVTPEPTFPPPTPPNAVKPDPTKPDATRPDATPQPPPEATTTALRITELTPRGPAARAGLQTGDVIVKVDGKRVTTPDELRQATAAAEKVSVLFYNPDDQKVDTREVAVAGGKLGLSVEAIPVALQEDEAVTAARPAGATAAQVTDVVARGPAARAGLQVGDVILTVDGKQVDGPAALAAALKAAAEVEVAFVDPDTGKPQTRKVKPANGDIGLTVRAVAVSQK